MIVRLSVMMFLQYAIMGAWAPVLGPYLKTLDLTNSDTAWIWSTAAIGSIAAPLVWGQIADRWLSAERCISLCAAVAGATLWGAAQFDEAWALFLAFLGFWLFQMPILSVGTALTFRHLERPRKQFAPIRMWGTIGWMAAGWTLSLWLSQFDRPIAHFADSFRTGAIAAWMLAAYAFTLPATPPLTAPNLDPSPKRWRRWLDAPIRAAHLFRTPAFTVYCVCLFTLYVSWAFNMQMTSLVVRSLASESAMLPTIMSLAQSTEVAALAALPFILDRFGQKRTMMVGISSWWLALVALAIGSPAWLVIPSLLLHGVYTCCFLVAGQVFVNRIAHHHYRASAQGILVLVNGLGQIVGNFLVGVLRDWNQENYPRVFVPAAIGIGMLALYFALEFRPTAEHAET